MEATVGGAISMFINGTEKLRPLTHDLMAMILQAFGARVERVIINHLENGTYFVGNARADNTVTYKTPTFAGFTTYAQYSFDMNTKQDTPLGQTEGKYRPFLKQFGSLLLGFFIGTHPNGTESQDADLKTALLGVSNGIAVYLLYNGILGDKSAKGGNVLTRQLLSSLPPHDGTRIIYGNGCRIGAERLRRENIIFRQIPYEVRVS